MRFESFVTLRAVPVLWGLIVTIHVAIAIGAIAIAFIIWDGFLVGAVAVVAAPLIAFLSLLMWRLALEFLVTQFEHSQQPAR